MCIHYHSDHAAPLDHQSKSCRFWFINSLSELYRTMGGEGAVASFCKEREREALISCLIWETTQRQADLRSGQTAWDDRHRGQFAHPLLMSHYICTTPVIWKKALSNSETHCQTREKCCWVEKWIWWWIMDLTWNMPAWDVHSCTWGVVYQMKIIWSTHTRVVWDIYISCMFVLSFINISSQWMARITVTHDFYTMQIITDSISSGIHTFQSS